MLTPAREEQVDTDAEVLRLLQGAHAGRGETLGQIFPLVYEELRRIAHRQLGQQRSGHTLSTTALVHEVYLKLVGGTRLGWTDRAHFLGVAARAMRQVLVDYARKHQAQKRGGARQRVPLEEAVISLEAQAETLLALDQALERLAALNPRLGRVVECRFFGGLSEAETAGALGVTERTVRRDWVKARLWLYEALYGETPSDPEPTDETPHSGR